MPGKYRPFTYEEIQEALKYKCPSCGAEPGVRCKNTVTGMSMPPKGTHKGRLPNDLRTV